MSNDDVEMLEKLDNLMTTHVKANFLHLFPNGPQTLDLISKPNLLNQLRLFKMIISTKDDTCYELPGDQALDYIFNPQLEGYHRMNLIMGLVDTEANFVQKVCEVRA